MTSSELDDIAIEAMRLQNGYARAIDTRDWDLFRALFTPDVVAEYPGMPFSGIEHWLEFFVPFHDDCTWILHAMTNHVVGMDADGVWGTCYGFVEWTMRDRPKLINRSRTLYRDRLIQQNGSWVIARRKCDLLMNQADAPIPDGITYPNSVLDLADIS
ncbi:nuclear transport factor 2 family protein [Nocardia vinacea]|uniref:nuclear transport factor 2 family protein n=1 Tax=Nocardia vinacea TaxID=96468 RepID=UPI0034499C27